MAGTIKRLLGHLGIIKGDVRVDGSVGIGTTPQAGTGESLAVDGSVRATELQLLPRVTAGPVVSFMFDDGFASNNTVMLPVFQAKGVAATAAFITDNVASGGSNATWAQVQALQAAGWEIASHGKTHTSLTGGGLTPAQIDAELTTSKAALEAHGLTVHGFAYPGGDVSDSVRRQVRQHYAWARGTRVGPNPLIVDQFNLYANAADDDAALAAFQALVDGIGTSKKWLIFTLHQTTAADATTIGSLIDYIQAANVPILTVSDALARMGNVLDFGLVALGECGIRIDQLDGLLRGSWSGATVTLTVPGGSGSGLKFDAPGTYIALKDCYLQEVGNVVVLKDGTVSLVVTPTYADNNAAKAGGLTAGQVYRTATGVLMVVY